MFIYLIQGLGFGLSAAAQPGPFQAYLLSQTMRNGWRRVLPAALAPLVSDGPITLLVLLVLTQLPGSFVRVIQVVGGAFILYLAWRGWRSFRETDFAAPAESTGRGQQSIFTAALMNLLNPNPYLFWSLIAGPILIEAWRITALHGLVFLVSFYATLMGGLAFLIVLFGAAYQLGPRVSRALAAFSIVVLLLFGLYQIVTGLLPPAA